MLIDSHAHLYFDKIKADLAGVLERAKQAQVGAIINIGTSPQSSQEALEQAKNLSTPDLHIFSTIGIHPHNLEKYFSNPDVSIHEDIDRLEEIYQEGQDFIIGVGECGLDYYIQSEDYPVSTTLEQIKQTQRLLFIAQVKLAKRLNLPLIIHCRQAWDEIFDYLDPQVKGVFHCFTGDKSLVEKILKETSLYISFAGMVTYPKNEDLRQAAGIVPLEKLLIETDTPFLAPQTHRGQTNEPSFVTETAQTLAKVKNISLEKLTNQTSINVKTLFPKTKEAAS